MRQVQFKIQNTAVPITLTEVGTVNTQGFSGVLCIQVKNAAGGNTLDQFAIKIKAHSEGDFVAWQSEGDFDGLTDSPNIWVSVTRPDELTAGSTALLMTNICGAYAIQILAATAANTSDVTVLGSLTQDQGI